MGETAGVLPRSAISEITPQEGNIKLNVDLCFQPIKRLDITQIYNIYILHFAKLSPPPTSVPQTLLSSLIAFTSYMQRTCLKVIVKATVV